MTKINVAVVGCGRWGMNHVRHFSTLSEARLVAIVDSDSERLRHATEAFPEIRVEQNHDRIFNETGLDAVVIATPAITHYRLVRQALLAGKHVLCEKPLCETAAQAIELVHLAAAHNAILMVGHVFLFNPGIVKIKEILNSGDIGSIRYLSAVWTNFGPIRQDVNAAYDLATHDIAIFNWFLNSEPETIWASGRSFLQANIEDVVLISLVYPGNVWAGIQASWLSPKKVREITVVGESGMIAWDDLKPAAPVAIHENQVTVFPETGNLVLRENQVRLPRVEIEEPLRVQNRYFLSRVRGEVAEPRSEGAFGAGVVRTLEAVLGSLRLGGVPVSLDQGRSTRVRPS